MTLSPTDYPTGNPTPAPIQRKVTLAPTDSPTDNPTPAPIQRKVTLAPTMQDDEMVYFTIQIDFFAGKEREPTEQEIKSMVCQVNKFFEKHLKERIDPGINVFASEIHYEWDERAALPSVVEFFADASYGNNGQHVPAQEVFDVMDDVDVKQFVEEYIWLSEPYKDNIFYQTEDIFFAGSYTGAANPPEPKPGMISRVEGCPNPM